MEENNKLDVAFSFDTSLYDMLSDEQKSDLWKIIIGTDAEFVKLKILNAIKQKWVAEYGSLEDVEDLRNGFFVAGFAGTVLNELFPTEK